MQSSAKNTDEFLASLPAWQKENLVLFRKLVHEVVPEITEEIKWGVPVFMVNGKMLFAMSNFKAHTKFNFIANGALLEDPDKLFNNGFDSKKSRGIDMHEGDTINTAHLKALITQAAEKLL